MKEYTVRMRKIEISRKAVHFRIVHNIRVDGIITKFKGERLL